MQSYDPAKNEREAPVQTRTDMNPNALPPTVDDFPPMREEPSRTVREILDDIHRDQQADMQRMDREAAEPWRSGPKHLTDAQYVEPPTQPRILLREQPQAVPYMGSSTAELDDIRTALCDSGDPVLLTKTPSQLRSYAQALWNELHRLRMENAAYRARHLEQEQSIVQARAERDNARAAASNALDRMVFNVTPRETPPELGGVKFPDTVPWPKVVAYAGGANEGGLHAWVDVHLDDTDKPTRYVLEPSPGMPSYATLWNERDEARQELAALSNLSMDLAQARGDLDQASRDLTTCALERDEALALLRLHREIVREARALAAESVRAGYRNPTAMAPPIRV